MAALGRRRGVSGVTTVTAEELVSGARWRHVLDGPAARTTVALRGGTVLDSTRLGAVVDRVRVVPPVAFASERDRAYAVAEWSALFLAWLSGLACPVVNRPLPARWLPGPPSALRTRAAAASLGLPVVAGALTPVPADEPGAPATGVLVAGATVVGSPSPAWADACRQVARALGLALVSVRLRRRDQPPGWSVDDVDPFPALDRPGEADAAAELVAGLARC